MFGAGPSDANNVGAIDATSAVDLGTTATSFSTPTPVFNTGFPGIGDSDTLEIVLGLTDATVEMTAEFRSSQSSSTWNEAFSRTNGIDFLLVRDNEAGEQYRINSVEFIVPEVGVPEPASLALLGVGLAGLALSRRKRA